jgi:hypothetical protein
MCCSIGKVMVNRAHQSFAAVQSCDAAAAPGVQSRDCCAVDSPVDKGPGTRLEVDTMCLGVLSVYVVLVILAICLVCPLVSSARNMRLLELQVDGKMVSDLGNQDFGGSTSKELSGSDTMKRRERRAKGKDSFKHDHMESLLKVQHPQLWRLLRSLNDP